MKLMLGNLDCKVLLTQDIQVEVSFEVLEGNPDFVEVYAHLGNETHAKIDIEISDGITSYKTTLKLLFSNTVYTIACCPRKINSQGEYVDHYEEDGTNIYWEKYCVNIPVTIPYKTSNENDEFPAPVITQIAPYPKKISSKSGVLITWQTGKKYTEYELLIRITGEVAYDIISFKATVNNSYNLLSQKLGNVPIDFIMSDLNHLHNYEIQIRGIQPASFPLHTYYSKWSNVVSFHSAIALNSLRAYFHGNNLNIGIRNYLPQNINVSLRKQMWFDDIY